MGLNKFDIVVYFPFEKRMGVIFSKGKKSIYGAGCIFTDGSLILAGYQPTKKTPIISGIGGKRDEDEYYFETAHRELLEEVFGIKEGHQNLSTHIERMIKPVRTLYVGNYVNLVYTFKDLEYILILIHSLSMKSEFYDEFPQNLQDLIFKRKTVHGAEIQQLVILPVAKFTVADEFNKDIRMLLAK